MSRPKVDVVVVTYNTAAVTVAALRNLLDHDQGVDLEIIVHDNASEDGTVAALQSEIPEASVVGGTENLGFAGGVNRALSRSSAPFVLLLNSDAWPEEGAIAALVTAAEAQPVAAAVAPRLERPDGRLEHSTHPFPSLKVAAITAFGLQRVLGRARSAALALEPAWAHDAATGGRLGGRCRAADPSIGARRHRRPRRAVLHVRRRSRVVLAGTAGRMVDLVRACGSRPPPGQRVRGGGLRGTSNRRVPPQHPPALPRAARPAAGSGLPRAEHHRVPSQRALGPAPPGVGPRRVLAGGGRSPPASASSERPPGPARLVSDPSSSIRPGAGGAGASARLRTEQVSTTLRVAEGSVRGERQILRPDGSMTVILNPPARRRWTPDGVLLDEHPVSWRLHDDADGVFVSVEEPAEVDLLDLDPAAAAIHGTDRSRPLMVPGSFAALGGPETLGRFLVGSRVMDVNLFEGRRCPSEQTALALYRVARWRGGQFWDAVADCVAEAVALRVQAAGDNLLVHDLWHQRESHVRFQADAALLLLAQAERRGVEARWSQLAESACRALDAVTVDGPGGLWTLHDSLERDAGRNDLVLNTHAQVLLVRHAFGRDVGHELDHLDDVLRVPPARWRTLEVGLATLASTAVAAHRSALRPRAERVVVRARHAAEGLSADSGRLRFPGGWTSRDASGRPAPPYYHAVNLNDLASLLRNRASPAGRRTLRSGVRFGRLGYFRWQREHRDPTAVLQPVLLANGGWPRAAVRAARALEDAGFVPAVGWPGVRDRLWSNLAEGTP